MGTDGREREVLEEFRDGEGRVNLRERRTFVPRILHALAPLVIQVAIVLCITQLP